jgi:hypothetical protein
MIESITFHELLNCQGGIHSFLPILRDYTGNKIRIDTVKLEMRLHIDEFPIKETYIPLELR